MLLIILSFLILTVYICCMIYKVGEIPSSVSATFYALEHKLWFGISMVVAALLLMPIILENTPDKYQFIAFLACTGMILVGSAPNFKEDFERYIHISGASMVLICSQIWVLVTNYLFLLIWVPFLIYMIYKSSIKWNGDIMNTMKNADILFWVEVVCILSTYSCVFCLI